MVRRELAPNGVVASKVVSTVNSNRRYNQRFLESDSQRGGYIDANQRLITRRIEAVNRLGVCVEIPMKGLRFSIPTGICIRVPEPPVGRVEVARPQIVEAPCLSGQFTAIKRGLGGGFCDVSAITVFGVSERKRACREVAQQEQRQQEQDDEARKGFHRL